MEPTPLRAARKAAGLRQYQVAAALGLAQGHYSDIESGRRPLVLGHTAANLDLVFRLARLLKITPAEIVGEEFAAQFRQAGSRRRLRR